MATLADVETGVRAVRARIRYLAEGSFINRRYVSAGVEVNTGRYEDHEVTIRDGRSIADRFRLDVHGFQLLDHRSAVADFHDRDAVERLYAAESAELARAVTGADLVLPQGWMIRTSADIPRAGKVVGYRHQGGLQPPAGEAHVDFSPQTAPRTAETVYRAQAPDGPGYRRFTAFSLWRCFSPPPQDVPLALCDGRSLADDEGVPNTLHIVDEIPSEAERLAPLPDGEAPVAASIFRYRSGHVWWYFSNMHAGEALLFKFFDSDHDVAWRCPHTAFRDTSFANANHRASIELRLIAYYE